MAQQRLVAVSYPADAGITAIITDVLDGTEFSIDIASMIPRGLRLYGELCGFTLARAHARSGDEIAIAAYLGGSDVFDEAIADFAAAYADQNERDYKAFTSAIASGRLHAERGV